MSSKLSAIMIAGLLAISPAVDIPASHATTIGFEGAPVGPGFTGPITESGFVYSRFSGNLFINNDGNPGHNVEPSAGTGGVLEIVSATAGSLFQFSALDLASGAGAPVVSVEGLFGGSPLATDNFTGPGGGLPGPYTTEHTSNLLGKNIDELLISLPASPESAIDNVVLNAAAVPEPASLALLVTALTGLGLIHRRRKTM
jgi:hypothetical protein